MRIDQGDIALLKMNGFSAEAEAKSWSKTFGDGPTATITYTRRRRWEIVLTYEGSRLAEGAANSALAAITKAFEYPPIRRRQGP